MKINFKRPGRTVIIALALATTVLAVGAMAAGHHHGCRRDCPNWECAYEDCTLDHEHCVYGCTLQDHEHCGEDCTLEHQHCVYGCTLDHDHNSLRPAGTGRHHRGRGRC